MIPSTASKKNSVPSKPSYQMSSISAWLKYTLQENHKPARSLSEQQKKKILDGRPQTFLFREIVFGELQDEEE